MEELIGNIRLRTKQNIVLHLKRFLPGGRGEFVVRVGQEVHPDDILGEGIVPVGFRTIHLAEGLGIEPARALFHLKPKLGQNVYQGELLAEREALWGLRKVRLFAPVDGIIDFYDQKSGDLKIKFAPKKTKLASGVFGIVDEVNLEKGYVLVRTLASLILGIFGSGKEREGIIRVVGEPGTLVSSKQISSSFSGEISVGGGIVFLDALERSLDVGVGGIITGGINAIDYKTLVGGQLNVPGTEFKPADSTLGKWSDVGVSVVVTEGFGAVQIGMDIFTILKAQDGMFAVIDGNKAKITLPSGDPDSLAVVRRTKLPVVENEESSRLEQVSLKKGMKVRLTTAPFFGTQGIIDSIDRAPTKLRSGIETTMVVVRSGSRQLVVAYQNVEAIF